MIVYIIQYSAGDVEFGYTWLGDVYTTKEAAEIVANAYNEKLSQLSELNVDEDEFCKIFYSTDYNKDDNKRAKLTCERLGIDPEFSKMLSRKCLYNETIYAAEIIEKTVLE